MFVDSDQPLAGITVVELGQLVAAPIVSLILADLGANVVKVERPDGGDRVRNFGTAGDAMFQTLNRNKRSMALDLKSGSGRELYLRLVDSADIVIENLAPGVADRLGVGYAAVKAENPAIIYLSIKGFFDGPYGNRAAMDTVAEAMSGFMRMTGEPDGKPLRAGTSIADIVCGLYGTIGILTALRNRDQSGMGQKISTGIFESITHSMMYWIGYAQFQHEDPQPIGAGHPAMDVYDIFKDQHGEWIFIGVVSETQWQDLCEIIDRPDLLIDERFQTYSDRIRNKDELQEIVQREIQTRKSGDLLDELIDAGIPGAPLNRPSDLVDDPHLDETGFLIEAMRDDGRSYKTILTPITGTMITPENRLGAPRLGEHTDEILRELDIDPETITQ